MQLLSPKLNSIDFGLLPFSAPKSKIRRNIGLSLRGFLWEYQGNNCSFLHPNEAPSPLKQLKINFINMQVMWIDHPRPSVVRVDRCSPPCASKSLCKTHIERCVCSQSDKRLSAPLCLPMPTTPYYIDR